MGRIMRKRSCGHQVLWGLVLTLALACESDGDSMGSDAGMRGGTDDDSAEESSNDEESSGGAAPNGSADGDGDPGGDVPQGETDDDEAVDDGASDEGSDDVDVDDSAPDDRGADDTLMDDEDTDDTVTVDEGADDTAADGEEIDDESSAPHGDDAVSGAGGASGEDDSMSADDSDDGSAGGASNTDDADDSMSDDSAVTDDESADDEPIDMPEPREPCMVAGSRRSCTEIGLVGACAEGTQFCRGEDGWDPCSIQPVDDLCYANDDSSCNGIPNEGCACLFGEQRSCAEDGALGACAAGVQRCDEFGEWGDCSVQPEAADGCEPGNDQDCDGTPNGGCPPCDEGSQVSCNDSIEVGACQSGASTCTGGQWTACAGTVLPGSRDCSSSDDNDCDGTADQDDPLCRCVPGAMQECETHGQDGVGLCRAGMQVCELLENGTESDWGACYGSIGPMEEICDSGEDENCDGYVDLDDMSCPCASLGGPSMARMLQGYCIDSTEVTRGQYQAWLSTNPVVEQGDECAWNDSFEPEASCMASLYCQDGCGNHPQPCVDWCDASAYCAAVGKSLCGKYDGSPGDHLLSDTQDQWYTACSSGDTNTYPYGDSYDAQDCNGQGYAGGIGDTVIAGSLASCSSSVAGYTGAFDLSGNLSEWLNACGSLTEPLATCEIRGGSYLSDDYLLECETQVATQRDTTSNTIGFRCCRPR